MHVPWSIPNITQDDIEYIKTILDTKWYTMGNIVKLFENNIKDYVKRKYSIAVNSGTSAIEIALRSLDIGYNDEVIVPSLSYIATATSVNLVNAKPVFIDVDKSMTINPNHIDNVITEKTKAIICVDLTGNPCDYNKINKKCDEYNIKLIVDGAQSLGSKYYEKQCLSFGIISTTSFHAAKILTTVEGGMVFTDDYALSEKIKSIRNQGEKTEKYVHEYIGGNFRMTDILASFGIKQFERFDTTLENRNRKINYYKNILKEYVDFLDVRSKCTSCNFIFPIFHNKRDKLAKFLKNHNIDTRKIYPYTIPQQPIYNIKKRFHISEWFCNNCLSLPLYNDLNYNEIEYVCNTIKDFLC